MRRGFRNLLLAAHSRRVRKLIHLSSLAIFGEDPPEETADPSSRAFDRLSAYGQLKRWQDDQVFRMHRKGLQSYIICPGNITGPYSRYSVGLFARIRRGPVPLVDEGCYPTNLVHVDNVVEALLTVASSDRGAGRRYFVNEVLPITWKDYIRDFAECARLPLKTIPVCRDEVLDVMSDGEKCAGISEQIRILLSGEFRQALSVVPFIARLNESAISLFENLPMDWQRSIRARFGRPINIAKIHFGPDLTEAWVRVQVRRVFHSPNSLVETFGWRPAVDYRKGLQLTAKWLQFVDYGEWKQ